jgi:hydrogenase expression/formation protein HypD
MEVCGTHTVAVFRHGIRGLLPESIRLLSGPGCPVCVTSIKDVDTAVALSKVSGVVLVTFGDMMRVPGSSRSLYEAKAEGADVRVVYSPLDALKIASENKDRRVVFFATGFETTSPLVAATLFEAEKEGIENFYIYSVHKLVPPALKALLDSPEVNVDGFILPGHVSTIIGSRPYEFIGKDHGIPSVITGFDAKDILEGILMLLKQLDAGMSDVQIQYRKVVREEGNPRAVATINECFKPSEVYWRGIGTIPESGLILKDKYRKRDITEIVNVDVPEGSEPKGCSCGEVLRGVKLPTECALFAKKCTPETPVGACMVSTEGSCAAYYRYRSG